MMKSDRVLVASIEEKDPLQALDVEGRQNLKEIEDELVDILLVLDATEATISSLLQNYTQFCVDTSSTSEKLSDDNFDHIDSALRERQRDVLSNRKNMETLHTKVQGTTNLVSLDTFAYSVNMTENSRSSYQAFSTLGMGILSKSLPRSRGMKIMPYDSWLRRVHETLQRSRCLQSSH